MSDRRRERRFPLDLRADLAVLSTAGSEPAPARTIDLSKSGIKVRVKRVVEKGSYVEVRWPSLAVFGEVRHTREVAPGEFDVGIEIEQLVHGAALMKSEHLSVTSLALYLSGALSGLEMGQANRHLENCPMCKRMLVEVEDRTLGEVAVRPGEEPA